MGDNKRVKRVVVDFVFPAESESIPDAVKRAAGAPLLGKCSACGGKQYVLANELHGEPAQGIPASRMYECMDCGTYRLG